MNLDIKYEKLIGFFRKISSIPRNSKEEEKIADFLCDFAKERGLFFQKDEHNNVIIKKGATPGYESRKSILFQAHTDMVCEKTSESKHDFRKDPIEIIQEGDILRAKDTTLGGDDGIGVAYLLLLLDDKEIEHPDIECLFTTQEEIGMYGARDFNYSDIKAHYLINIDGEEEDTAIVGCAGGVSVNYLKNITALRDINTQVYKLSISGLFGGHSGVDIQKGRINSNWLAAKILKKIENINITSFIGGNKDNAIANATEVIFSTNEENIDKCLDKALADIVVTKADENLRIDIEKIDFDGKALNVEESNNIISLIMNLKQNVIDYVENEEDMVETSGNIGIVNIKNGKIKIVESLRSSIDAKKEEVKKYNNELATKLGFEIIEEGSYPGWKYDPNSEIKEVYIDAYKKNHEGKDPIVCAIHAGVECGMIYEKLPYLDMISIGPNVKDVHTVNEKLYLNSCKRLLCTLIDIIKNLY